MNVKDRIKEKAFEMYIRFGIRSVSMDDIAGELGMSKKTIYQHFADKDELVKDVVEYDINQDKKECENACGHSVNAVDELYKIMEFVLAQFGDMNPMVLFDLQKYHPKSYQLFKNYKNGFLMNTISENIHRGIDEGLYRDDMNVDIIAKYRLEAIFIAFNIDLFPPGKYNIPDVIKQTTEHFLFGLSSAKGYKLIEQYKTQLQKKNSL